MKKYPELLEAEEEAGLVRAAQAGDTSARDRLVASQMRLVHKIAHRHRPRGMEHGDLVQEGVFGLFKAINKFDPKKGCRLSSYAKYWIASRIIYRRQNTEDMIRMPVHLHEKRKGTWHGETLPSVDSLSHVFGVHGAVFLGSLMEDDRLDAEEVSERHRRVALVRAAVETLDRKEQSVARAVFGIGCNEPMNRGQQQGSLRMKPNEIAVAAQNVFDKLKRALSA